MRGQEGRSVRHVAIHQNDEACGGFHENSAPTDVGDNAVCLLTALKPGGKVSQTCYDPKKFSTITVKEAVGEVELALMELTFKGDGKPTAIVIKNPKLFGLDPSTASPAWYTNIIKSFSKLFGSGPSAKTPTESTNTCKCDPQDKQEL